MGRVKKKLLEQAEEFKDILFEDLDIVIPHLMRNPKKIILEIGCGNGIFFANLVKNHPDNLCIGCDLRKDRLVKAIKKIMSLQGCVNNEIIQEKFKSNNLKFKNNLKVTECHPALDAGSRNKKTMDSGSCPEGQDKNGNIENCLKIKNFKLKIQETSIFNSISNIIKNYILYSGDGKELVSNLPDKIIQKLYINFPDPHPRKKEWKYRFFMPDIMEILKIKMTQDGEIQIKTDDYDYFIFTRTIFYLFRKDFQETYFSLDVHSSICHFNNKKCHSGLDPESIPHNYIITEFEQKWLDKGKKIYQVNYRKK